MNEITLKSSFESILGKKREDYSDKVRQERWNYWKILVSKKKRWLMEVWSNTKGCEGCIHLNKKESWCNLQGLPCTVNPILSFQNALPGLACMGAGYDDGLLPGIDFMDDDLPF
ncbi:hypothetical protein [Leptospira stimsonii]|uniref:Uncharacterized protein n=1 Tax=Leptospira stimsonii TaxID=2202203 RepID=A0A396Z8C6_9LEPT|nr:hypothetical protein [Leptospira stimsonii]RHX89888.1 hypothetical protein DLM75_13115 [Leptospira stimsonii]